MTVEKSPDTDESKPVAGTVEKLPDTDEKGYLLVILIIIVVAVVPVTLVYCRKKQK
jgi:LPXTG-motif cell wall-anchored protein